MPTPSQDVYYHIYRGRQAWIYHLAYMRLSKVFALLHALRNLNVSLPNKAIFDYGFSTGTFFRHCPTSCALFGVELDAANVNSVDTMLRKRGFTPSNSKSLTRSDGATMNY